MSFSYYFSEKIYNISLRMFKVKCIKLHKIIKQQYHLNDLNKKKMSLSAFLKKGSLTIEAAMTLPFFMFAILCVIYGMEVLRLQMNIQAALHQTAKELAQYAHVYYEFGGNEPEAVRLLMNAGLSQTYVKNEVIKYAGREYLEHTVLDGGGGGLDFWETSLINEEQMIDIIVKYKIKLPFSIIFGNYSAVQRARMHAWCGYDGSFKEAEHAEIMVYMTKNGVVYHKHKSCTYLLLSVQQVNLAGIEKRRNQQGGKYRACEICIDEGNQLYVYITDTGDRYHGAVLCRGLKRDIYRIPLSEAQKWKECSRCF